MKVYAEICFGPWMATNEFPYTAPFPNELSKKADEIGKLAASYFPDHIDADGGGMYITLLCGTPEFERAVSYREAIAQSRPFGDAFKLVMPEIRYSLEFTPKELSDAEYYELAGNIWSIVRPSSKPYITDVYTMLDRVDGVWFPGEQRESWRFAAGTWKTKKFSYADNGEFFASLGFRESMEAEGLTGIKYISATDKKGEVVAWQLSADKTLPPLLEYNKATFKPMAYSKKLDRTVFSYTMSDQIHMPKEYKPLLSDFNMSLEQFGYMSNRLTIVSRKFVEVLKNHKVPRMIVFPVKFD